MFTVLSHTADIGLEVEAPTLAELFQEAARGWKKLVMEDSEVRPKEQQRIHLNSTSLEDLLVQWLGELNFLLTARGWLLAGVEDFALRETPDGWELKAVVTGEPFDPGRHEIYFDIKGVTYHQLHIEKKGGGYRTRIIFDI